MSKRLILLRHAHREKNLGHHIDNGLSEKGKKQVARLVKFFEKKFNEEKPVFYSSPKKRCVETAEPVAELFSEKVQIMKHLDEGDFLENRVQEIIKWWVREAPPLTVLCSHGDLIPLLVYQMTGARVEFKKGAMAEISGPSGAPWLYTLIQEF